MSEDRTAFEAVAAARLPWLRRTAYALCGDRHLADDLTQTTLMKLFLAWPLRDPGWVDGWLRTTLTRSYLDERRRPRWRREHPVEWLPELAAPAVPASLDDALIRSLASLPRQQRACLVLRFLEDCSVEETAALLGCSTGTVKSHTSRGVAALRSTFDPTLTGGRP